MFDMKMKLQNVTVALAFALAVFSGFAAESGETFFGVVDFAGKRWYSIGDDD